MRSFSLLLVPKIMKPWPCSTNLDHLGITHLSLILFPLDTYIYENNKHMWKLLFSHYKGSGEDLVRLASPPLLSCYLKSIFSLETLSFWTWTHLHSLLIMSFFFFLFFFPLPYMLLTLFFCLCLPFVLSAVCVRLEGVWCAENDR